LVQDYLYVMAVADIEVYISQSTCHDKPGVLPAAAATAVKSLSPLKILHFLGPNELER
jgi:hypothetical protein